MAVGRGLGAGGPVDLLDVPGHLAAVFVGAQAERVPHQMHDAGLELLMRRLTGIGTPLTLQGQGRILAAACVGAFRAWPGQCGAFWRRLGASEHEFDSNPETWLYPVS